jgi:hypothetical protein
MVRQKEAEIDDLPTSQQSHGRSVHLAQTVCRPQRKNVLHKFKRIVILKPVALLALMHMLPFMLYEALSYTPFKFIGLA